MAFWRARLRGALFLLRQVWSLWRVSRRPGGADGQLQERAPDAFAVLRSYAELQPLTQADLSAAQDQLDATGDVELFYAWARMFRLTTRRLHSSQRVLAKRPTGSLRRMRRPVRTHPRRSQSSGRPRRRRPARSPGRPGDDPDLASSGGAA